MKHSALVLAALTSMSLIACTLTGGGGTQMSSSSASTSSAVSSETAMIVVESHAAGDTVASPLTITGRARGGWYFEASFPVQLLDGNNNQIVISPAQAQGDWMTSDFVPFSVTLTFAPPLTATGTIVLHRDNPSGLPENDASISIPVNF